MKEKSMNTQVAVNDITKSGSLKSIDVHCCSIENECLFRKPIDSSLSSPTAYFVSISLRNFSSQYCLRNVLFTLGEAKPLMG